MYIIAQYVKHLRVLDAGIMRRTFSRHLAGERFEVYSAGIDPTEEVHPCAVEAMVEVGVDISDQYPKDLKTYLGREFFNYLVIVCARAEERCPKTFPGVGTRFSWIFDDPRRDEDLPYDSTLERFRVIRDEIELKIRGWLEHPEEELRKLYEERERERRERLEAARREAEGRNAFASIEGDEAASEIDPVTRASRRNRFSGLAYST